jgi:hypothetical protein
MPRNAVLSLEGTETIAGQKCDKVLSKFQGPLGQTEMRFSISTSGLVYFMRVVGRSPEGTVDRSWRMSGYTTYRTIPQSRFTLTIPDGFVPFALPDRVYPAEIDRPLNLKGWVNAATGKAWTPPARRPILFLLTTPESLPCTRAQKAISAWKSELGQKGVEVVMGSIAESKASAGNLLWNPDGHSRAAMSAPSTPMIYLVNSSGVLKNLWMGFGPNSSGSIKSELMAAVAKLK